MTVVVVLAGWVGLSLPVGILVGRAIGLRDTET